MQECRRSKQALEDQQAPALVVSGFSKAAACLGADPRRAGSAVRRAVDHKNSGL